MGLYCVFYVGQTENLFLKTIIFRMNFLQTSVAKQTCRPFLFDNLDKFTKSASTGLNVDCLTVSAHLLENLRFVWPT